MKMTDAMNTYNLALEKMRKMGYVIALVDNDEDFDWEARKAGDVFIASDPLRLLGLLSIKDVEQPMHNH